MDAIITTYNITRSMAKVVSNTNPPYMFGCINTNLNLDKDKGAHIAIKQISRGALKSKQAKSTPKRIHEINNCGS